MEKVKVAISGASGNISYATMFRVVSGEVFGSQTEIELRLLDIEPAIEKVKGVAMELDDCAFPLLKKVICTSDPRVAFEDADWALLIGSVPRKAGMERKDLLAINGKIFTEQGRALSDVAKASCKILVVGNPCNTNAFIAKTAAEKIDGKNFFALTMLDQNRGLAQLAQKAGVDVRAVKNLAIWGNHSATQYPDFYHSVINGLPTTEVILDEGWLQTDFITTVQKRGSAIIQARGGSSVASAANAVVDTVKNLITPTPKGEIFSIAVCSDGSYGIEEGLIFGYPIRSDGKDWEIVQGFEHGEFSLEKIRLTQEELLKEKEVAMELFSD